MIWTEKKRTARSMGTATIPLTRPNCLGRIVCVFGSTIIIIIIVQMIVSLLFPLFHSNAIDRTVVTRDNVSLTFFLLNIKKKVRKKELANERDTLCWSNCINTSIICCELQWIAWIQWSNVKLNGVCTAFLSHWSFSVFPSVFYYLQ